MIAVPVSLLLRMTEAVTAISRRETCLSSAGFCEVWAFAVDAAVATSRQNRRARTHNGRGTFNIKTKLPFLRTTANCCSFSLLWRGLWRGADTGQIESCVGS